MTNSFTAVFAGTPISVAQPSLISYSLTALAPQILLSWPTEFNNTPNNVSYIVQVTASTTGCSLVMPNFTYVSVGTSSLFFNNGPNTITIYANDKTTVITTVAPSQIIYMYVTDNTTANGVAQIVPFGGGYAAVISVGAVSTSPDLIITGSPITSSGVFSFSLGADLLSITGFGSGTGIVVHTGVNSFNLRSIVGTVNQIVVTNGSGIAGNPTLALAANVNGITSLTASNIQIGVAGTNQISTANSAPIVFNCGVGLENTALTFFDSTGIGYASIEAPTTGFTTNATYQWPVAPPPANGYALSSNTSGNMFWASNTGGGTVTVIVPQAAHGFTAGQAVYLNGTVYTLAIATSPVTAEVVGIVAVVLDVNTFELTTVGHVTGLSGLSAGGVYWLSDATPGLVTITKPTSAGNIEKPIWIADTTTSAYVYQERGKIIPNPSSGIVTSVSVTSSTLNVTGSPITTAGTIDVELPSSVGGKNLLYNGDFQLWQRGTTFTASTAPTGMYTADRWQFGLNSNNYTATYSQVAGPVFGTYAVRINRTAGAVATGSIELLQSLPITSCVGLAGKYLTITFDVMAGTDFNGGNLTTGLQIAVTTGTGTTSISDLYGYFTGRAIPIQASNIALSTSWQTFTFTSAAPIGSGVTQVSAAFVYVPLAGSGSANDYYEVTNVKLETGSFSTTFEHNDFQTNLDLCTPFYCKSFEPAITPATGVGINTGETITSATQVTTGDFNSQSVSFPQRMLAVPSMTLYNPVSANALAYNENRSQDCGATSVSHKATNGFTFTGTGSASTNVSDRFGLHWAAQAELFNSGFPS